MIHNGFLKTIFQKIKRIFQKPLFAAVSLGLLLGYANAKTVRCVQADCIVTMTMFLNLKEITCETAMSEDQIETERYKWSQSAWLYDWYLATESNILMFDGEAVSK